MLNQQSWCGKNTSHSFEGQIAYFSAEYAIHNSLPIYAGGLGVLAGDICKQSSDLGLPLVAVGLCIQDILGNVRRLAEETYDWI
jgi:starch phosphorylase